MIKLDLPSHQAWNPVIKLDHLVIKLDHPVIKLSIPKAQGQECVQLCSLRFYLCCSLGSLDITSLVLHIICQAVLTQRWPMTCLAFQQSCFE